MKTNFLASSLTLMTVTLAILVHQWRLTVPTGDCDRGRTNLERVLEMKPCFMRGSALPRLGEVCLKQSTEAARQHDYEGATEPLYSLLQRARTAKQSTGYEQEAERRLRRLPLQHLEHAHQLAAQGEVSRARRHFEQMRSLYPHADSELLPEAKRQAARCRLSEVVILVNARQFDEALDALKELCASDAPASVKDEAYTLVPDVADQAVSQRLRRGQVAGVFETLDTVRDWVEERPDIAARIDTLRERIGRQLFGESIGQDSTPVPTPVYAGPPDPHAPNSAKLRVKNSSPYPLRVIVSAGTAAHQRHVLSVKPSATASLFLPPGDYWEKASAPAAPFIHPYFGDMTLETGTYEQNFIVVTRR